VPTRAQSTRQHDELSFGATVPEAPDEERDPQRAGRSGTATGR